TARFAQTCALPLTRGAEAIFTYLVAVTLCFSSSTLYYTFSNHNQASIWQLIDHLGIITMIWASSMALTAFCFTPGSASQRAYFMAITAAALLSYSQLTTILLYSPSHRWDLHATHVVFGGLATLPAVHASYESHYQPTKQEGHLLKSFWNLLLLNTVGGGIYATGFVERMVGKTAAELDASHFTMHVFAVAGAWIYKRGLYEMVDTRREMP
ncbi:hypothetical protein K505DRAFT_260116, partial [Melanomma pulvis-pyrius CBS 109.77]